MAEKLENAILFDWLTISGKNQFGHRWIDKLLNLKPECTFTACGGRFFFTSGLRFENITKYFNNSQDETLAMLNMSGQGCRAFETFSLDPSFDRLFDFVMNSENNCNITRLDVAFDDFTGLLDLSKMYDQILKGHYVSPFGKFQYIHDLSNSRPIPFTSGESLCLGSMSSKVFFRVYDKKLERNRDDIEHWVRFEMQLRDEAAYGFLVNYYDFNKDIGKTFLSIVNKYIRFVTPSGDSNISRWNVAPWWRRFVNTCGDISLYSPKDIDYNIYRVNDYVLNQAGNSIDVLIQVLGEEQFMKLLRERKTKLKPRQINLIEAERLKRQLLFVGDNDETDQ